MKMDLGRRLRTSIFLVVQSISVGFSLDTTTDPVARALNQGDLRTAYHTLVAVEEGSKIAPLFYQVSMQANSDPTLKGRLNKVAMAFDIRLRKEMNSLTFSAYRQFAADGSLNEQDRMRLILPMVEGVSRLGAPQKDTLKAFLKGLLTSGISANMKSGLIIQATRAPSIGLGANSLMPFCRSTDSTVRKAAYRGLICTIAHNRALGNATLNHAVFDSIKGDGSRIPDAYQVLALASIGEDYARDYLLSKCAADPVKLVAIIRHDPYLNHPGLVIAALSFSKDAPQGVSTRMALRYGLKEPEVVANQIASAPYSDSAKAAELRRLMTVQSTASR